jgi:hypothetical protein
MKQKLYAASYLFTLWVLLSPAIIYAKEHATLMLRSTTSKRNYIAQMNPVTKGFKFSNVKPGTYTLYLIAPGEFFAATSGPANPPIIVQNMVWTTSGNKAMNVVNMTLPSITITSEMLAKPIPSGVKDRESAIILNPALTTVDLVNLTGTIANLPKEEY